MQIVIYLTIITNSMKCIVKQFNNLQRPIYLTISVYNPIWYSFHHDFRIQSTPVWILIMILQRFTVYNDQFVQWIPTFIKTIWIPCHRAVEQMQFSVFPSGRCLCGFGLFPFKMFPKVIKTFQVIRKQYDNVKWNDPNQWAHIQWLMNK